MTNSQANSRSIGQEGGEIWIGQALLQPISFKPDRLLGQADAKQKFLDSGVEAVSSTPEQLAAIIKSEISRLARVIKDAGIRAD